MTIENLIKFEVAPRPSVLERNGNGFYQDVIKSLLVLESTKSLVFSSAELSQGKIQYIKTLVRKHHKRHVKSAKVDGKTHLWVQ